MNRKGADRACGLHARIHGTPPEPPPDSSDARSAASAVAPADADRTAEPTARHCWVLTDTDTTQAGTWLPGLLLGWEKTASGWRGRVARQVPASGGWVVVVDWVPSVVLDRADISHHP